MSITVKTGWLRDKNGDKFAPKTLTSQVQTSDGVLLEDKMQADFDAIADAISAKKDKDLIVTFTDGSKTTATHTSAEIFAAVNEGTTVYFNNGGTNFHYLEGTSSVVTFYTNYYDNDMMQADAYIIRGNTITQQHFQNPIISESKVQELVGSAADSKFYVVTFEQGDDNKYHADLTFAEIREKFEAGGNMVARIDGTDYIPLLAASPTQIIFSGIYKAQSVSLTIDSRENCVLTTTQLSYSSHSHSNASTTIDGFMSKEDKIKIEGIETGAEVNVIESVTVNGEEIPVNNKTINIEISEQVQNEAKLPITLGAFQYYTWDELSGDTIEEQAQQLARFDVIVYQGALSENLSMSGAEYERDLALYTKALEYNPDLKVFGYVTARGFANSKSGGHVGMTEYRTSPDNVDHPIWTKEELCAYINLMAHCGGTKSETEVDEYGNPILTGGIPLYGVFYDDYDYNFTDDNTHLINQGDWTSIREKHNFLIDYAHNLGLSNMPNSNPNLVFNNDATPNSVRNPDGIPSHMNENDWFCLESYFIRSDYTFATNDNLASVYNEQYRDTYKSKCLALTYIYAVSDDAEDNHQVASTFAVCQAMCQGVDSIALQSANFVAEIPAEFAKFYDKNNSASYSRGTGFYKMRVNGYTVTATRSPAATAYGQVPNANALSTCIVDVDGHVFNNIFVNKEVLTYDLSNFKDEVNDKIDNLTNTVEQSSNLYHRAFIDDWQKVYTLADYTNHCFTFKGAWGGEDTGTTSSWNSAYPYDFQIRLPKLGSWRRIGIDVSHLAGKTVELGFDSCNVYVEGSPSTKVNLTWTVNSISTSNTVSTITTFGSLNT